MLQNCQYYRNGSLKTIMLDDGSVVHYDEDGNLQYVELSDSNEEIDHPYGRTSQQYK